ncbi:MAG TPA: PP2C family protein-serine/threonine phosphatase, partial [Acidobacteriota bacterium]|nr:PP2C family protein-serine/threonine phosphatase [Acidobacteriota bacterium]
SLGVGILRDHAVHQRSTPPEMLADLNRHLQTPGSQGRFIAMAFGVYDTARGEFHLANAGFPAPILIRDKRASVIPIGGLPIGILPDSVYESVCLRLRPGDVVVFCSDGIHEQQNALEEEFGVERLIARLTQTCEGSAAEQIAGRIVQAISEHAGDDACRECRDDQTIVVLRITEVKSARSGNGSENLL